MVLARFWHFCLEQNGRCTVMFLPILFERLFIYFQMFQMQRKNKGIVAQEEGCSWIASNYVWKKPDLPTFFEIVLTGQT